MLGLVCRGHRHLVRHPERMPIRKVNVLYSAIALDILDWMVQGKSATLSDVCTRMEKLRRGPNEVDEDSRESCAAIWVPIVSVTAEKVVDDPPEENHLVKTSELNMEWEGEGPLLLVASQAVLDL